MSDESVGDKKEITPAKQNSAKDEQAGQPPATPLPLIETEHRPENAEHPKNNEKSNFVWRKRFELVFKFIEFCALIAAIITAWVIFRQLKEMQKDRNLDERAWIDPYRIELSSDNNTNSFYYILHFKNIGRTPTKDTFAFIDVTTNFASAYVTGLVMTNFSSQPQFPSDDAQVHSDVKPISLYRDCWNNKIPLYIFGIVEYHDIFGKHHWVRFCWVNDVRSKNAYPAQTGNDCDTEN
jgi:hypothetical protein